MPPPPTKRHFLVQQPTISTLEASVQTQVDPKPTFAPATETDTPKVQTLLKSRKISLSPTLISSKAAQNPYKRQGINGARLGSSPFAKSPLSTFSTEIFNTKLQEKETDATTSVTRITKINDTTTAVTTPTICQKKTPPTTPAKQPAFKSTLFTKTNLLQGSIEVILEKEPVVMAPSRVSLEPPQVDASIVTEQEPEYNTTSSEENASTFDQIPVSDWTDDQVFEHALSSIQASEQSFVENKEVQDTSISSQPTLLSLNLKLDQCQSTYLRALVDVAVLSKMVSEVEFTLDQLETEEMDAPKEEEGLAKIFADIELDMIMNEEESDGRHAFWESHGVPKLTMKDEVTVDNSSSVDIGDIVEWINASDHDLQMP